MLRAARLRLGQARLRLEALAARLDSLSPLNVLGRGYSLTRTAQDRAVLRDARQVRPGDRLVTHLRRGRIVSRVEQVEDDPAGGVNVDGEVVQDARPDIHTDGATASFTFNSTATAGFNATGTLVNTTGHAYASYILGAVTNSTINNTASARNAEARVRIGSAY